MKIKIVTTILLTFILIIFFDLFIYADDTIKPIYDIPLDWALQDYTFEMSHRNGIEPELVLAIIEVESCYQSDVVNDSGTCFGLMQINKKSHKELIEKVGCKDIFDERDNIIIGIGILKDLFNKYDKVEYVLMAYNGGEEYLQKQIKKGISSTSYTKKVLAVQERLNEQSKTDDKEITKSNKRQV